MNDHLIDKELVDSSINDFFSILDVGFFKTRYERCSQSDKRFLFAMVKCGELPCTISNVAKNLHKNVNSISTIRAQLINKGIISLHSCIPARCNAVLPSVSASLIATLLVASNRPSAVGLFLLAARCTVPAMLT